MICLEDFLMSLHYLVLWAAAPPFNPPDGAGDNALPGGVPAFCFRLPTPGRPLAEFAHSMLVETSTTFAHQDRVLALS